MSGTSTRNSRINPRARKAKTPRREDVPGHFYTKWVPDDRPVPTKPCDHPACGSVGEYRAPKSRDMDDSNPLLVKKKNGKDFFWFCLDHVKIYNATWDYYKGLSVAEMEAAIRFDGVWNRPTWPLGQGATEQKIRGAFQKNFSDTGLDDGAEQRPRAEASPHTQVHRKAEVDALLELDLEPPVDFARIKKQYRLLVKKHHPDLQGPHLKGKDRQNEDRIKKLNSAFTFLKALYGDKTP